MALHTYTKTEYKNAPDHKTTPLNATNLNHSEDGIENAYTDIKYIYDETGDLIAPRQETLTADRAYSVGDQFIYGGKLYSVTQAISNGGTITIGTNCDLSGSVTEQIDEIDNAIGSINSVLLKAEIKSVTFTNMGYNQYSNNSGGVFIGSAASNILVANASAAGYTRLFNVNNQNPALITDATVTINCIVLSAV